MTKTLAEARDFMRTLLAAEIPATVQPFVLPAHTTLAAVAASVPAGSPVLIGAQDAHWSSEPEHTGSVSMSMVRDAGASLVEIGHAERRASGDSDAVVADKMRAALAHGLLPLLCVGEPADVFHSGRRHDYVASQLESALANVSAGSLESLIVAYEPIWSIGRHGRPADPGLVADMVRTMRAALPEVVPVLYGGSVTLDNAVPLLRQAGVDGLFVGRAAWDAAAFVELIHRCATVPIAAVSA